MAHKVILHICVLDKFIPPFVDFVKTHFEFEEHVFVLLGDINKYPVPLQSNVIHMQDIKNWAFVSKLYKADKVILHSLFHLGVVKLLAIQPWLLKKCYWIIWGWDLYVYSLGKRDKNWKLGEFFRRPVIKRMGNLVTGTTGDYLLAKKWYGARGKHCFSFNYPSNIFEGYSRTPKKCNTIIIQVGNSADPSNHHLEILKSLEKFANKDIKIITPLSYGDQEYAQGVITKGQGIFGDKFQALTSFMSAEEYTVLQGTIDIAIFNHRRQQAFGNMVTLLGFGKKVYVRKESTLNGVFKEYGLTVYDPENLNLDLIEDEIAKSNAEAINRYFSKEALVNSLKTYLN